MSSTRTSPLGSAIAFILSALFIVAAGWLFFNRQHVLDQFAVWGYAPTAEIEAINQRVGFTDKGEFLFYATRPALETQEGFNKECPRQEAGSPILGCYTTNDRIFIYNLNNEQLDGMEEVTAAHEMLHAAWYRMSDEEREKITTDLRAAYDKISDPELKERMGYYERTEPGEFANELHSILGTEIASLGEPLDSYYAKFFDRSAVLALHDKYSSVYDALYSRADELYTQMETLASSIESRSSTYDEAINALSADIEAFNAKADRNGFSSQSQFNSERAALLRRSNTLEAEREAINASIVTYNGYYAEYETLSQQIEVLNDSIDSFNQIDQGPSV